jgi:hypothetical protein
MAVPAMTGKFGHQIIARHAVGSGAVHFRE